MDMGMISKLLGTMAPSLANNPNARAMLEVVQSGDAVRGEQIANNLLANYGREILHAANVAVGPVPAWRAA